MMTMGISLIVLMTIVIDPVLSVSKESIRLNGLYETTSWDFLEDMYLYHNAIRYFHGARSLKFNRTVGIYFTECLQ